MKRWSRKKSLQAISRFDTHRKAKPLTEKDWDQLFFAIWSIEDWILCKFGFFRREGSDLTEKILLEIARQRDCPIPLYFIATDHMMSQQANCRRRRLIHLLNQPIPNDLFRPVREDGDRPCVEKRDFRTGPDPSGNDFWGLGF